MGEMAHVWAEVYQLPWLVLADTLVSGQLCAREKKVWQHYFPSPLNNSVLCSTHFKPSLIRVEPWAFLTRKACLLSFVYWTAALAVPKAACSSWLFPHGYLQAGAACRAANFTARKIRHWRSQQDQSWAAQGRWPGPGESGQDQGTQTKQGLHKATHVASLSAEAGPFPTGRTSIFLSITVQLKLYSPSYRCIYSCVIYLWKIRCIIYTNVDSGRPTVVFTPSTTLTVQAQVSHCICSLSLSFFYFTSVSELWTTLRFPKPVLDKLPNLFFVPKAVIRQNISLLLHSQNSQLIDTFFWGAGSPSHPPAQKVEPGKPQSSAWSYPLGGHALALVLCYSTETFLPTVVWKLFCFSPLHEHATVPKPKLRTCLCQCAL